MRASSPSARERSSARPRRSRGPGLDGPEHGRKLDQPEQNKPSIDIASPKRASVTRSKTATSGRPHIGSQRLGPIDA